VRPLPTGTLTLLFSDMEGSTSLLHRLGGQWGEALSAQRRIMRAAFAAHGGHEMGTEGDSFFVVFTSAHAGVQAAIEAQRGLLAHAWPGGVAVRVRIGLHTGEPQRHEDGYIGVDVHRAARIAATASGGQIVVSAATGALVAGQLDAELHDLGWHRLKDLQAAEHLFDVHAPGLPETHPPLRSLGTSACLPSYPTPLIGRDREVAELCEVLESGQARLVTLTGPGGTGKTRLAVAVTDELGRRAPFDAFLVQLATADRAALVWSGIAEAIGAPAEVEALPHERALRFLAGRAALLVLDNLEQIPDADVAVSRLLSEAPGVRILATSRRPLHLVEEHQYPVPPLTVPAWHPGQPAEAAQVGAVDLFVRRARMVHRSFALTPANVADVLAVCQRLDGLPLAIELAAARLRLLSPKALLLRLDDRLNDTTGESDRSARQRTLHATIAWSYDLLAEPDRAVFRRLGVFSSRFDLDAVAAVADSGGRDPLDVIAHLIDVSLVEVVEGADGEPMVYLLETVRRFARDLLRRTGEDAAVRLTHARWCLATVERITQLLGTPHQLAALDRMKAMEEDVRCALDWCLGGGGEATEARREVGFALLEPMDRYWYRFGYIVEGRGWHDRALHLLAAETVDSPRLVDALHGQGVLALQQLDLATGTEALERALAMACRLGDRFREARESNSLGVAHRGSGRLDEARALIERSLAVARAIGDPQRETVALTNLVHVHMDAGEYRAAVEAAHRAIAADESLGDPWGVAINRSNLVMALLCSEGPRPALEELRQVAANAAALDDPTLTVEVLDIAAAVWAALGDPERAAMLLGASDQERELRVMPRSAPDERHLERFLAPARQSWPAQEWDGAHRTGASMPLDQAIALSTAAASRAAIPAPGARAPSPA
jgi:predicted ATPase/class 3 adenylate cyclase